MTRLQRVSRQITAILTPEELPDTPSRETWPKDTPSSKVLTFQTSDGAGYKVYFYHQGEGIWEIGFGVLPAFPGGGRSTKPFEVIQGVAARVRDFLNVESPSHLLFSPTSESRQKLYKTMMRRFIPEAELDESRENKLIYKLPGEPSESVVNASRTAKRLVALNEEVAFLQAINENPSDIAPRLMYADWLEDRGDPLANFIKYLEEGLLKIQVDKELWGYGQGGELAQVVEEMSFPELRAFLNNGLYDWSTMEERPHILYESLTTPEDVHDVFPDYGIAQEGDWEEGDIPEWDEEEHMVTVELQKSDGTPWSRRELEYLYKALGLYAAHYLQYDDFPEDE